MSGKGDYTEIVGHLPQTLRTKHREIPGAMHGFGRLAETAKAEGALDPTMKELIACAISIALRCDGCIGFHTRGAIRAGANRQEFMYMIGVAIMMGGGSFHRLWRLCRRCLRAVQRPDLKARTPGSEAPGVLAAPGGRQRTGYSLRATPKSCRIQMNMVMKLP